MDNEIKKAQFKVSGIENREVNGNKIIILLDGKNRFDIWEKKRDGGNTKAWDEFQKFRFMIGDVVSVNFTESESGQNKYTGKPFINRRIISFEQVENTPVTSHTSQSNNSYESIPTIHIEGYSRGEQKPQNPQNNNDVNAIKESVKELIEEIRILSGRVNSLESNKTDVEITEIPF